MNRLTILDLFIMSSIERGVRTAYDLQRHAGLSLGASTPALKRLEKAGVVTRTTTNTAQRRRFEFYLSPKGKQQFRQAWREHLTAGNSVADIDSILRIIDLAFHEGADRESIGKFLGRVIESRKKLAKILEATTTDRSIAVPRDYRKLRERFDAKRFQFEATALAELKESILKRAGKRPRRRSRVQS